MNILAAVQAVAQFAQGKTQDAVVHHSANAAATAAPVAASIIFHLPEWTALVPMGLGVIWYLILIGEKIAGWISWARKEESGEPFDLPQGPHKDH